MRRGARLRLGLEDELAARAVERRILRGLRGRGRRGRRAVMPRALRPHLAARRASLTHFARPSRPLWRPALPRAARLMNC